MRPSHDRSVAVSLAAAAFVAVLTGCSGKGKGDAKVTPSPNGGGQQTQPGQNTPTPPPPDQPQLPGALAVMVENSPQSRPQAGLEQADLVYELEAEGGITRFMAFFYKHQVEKIGPVRSARMGFYDIAAAYAVPYAHAGGNYDVLLELKERNKRLLNLDEIYTCGTCFARTSDRQAPHNLYTSTAKLVARANELRFALKPLANFPAGAKMSGGKPSPGPTLSWGSGTQEVTWTWNGDNYMRYQDGGNHSTESGARVGANNVIVLITRYAWNPHPTGQPTEGQQEISIVGSGSGYLFRDSQVYPIRWQKPSRNDHYIFTTAEGAPVTLSAGPTWVEVIKAKDDLTAGLSG